MLKNSSHPFADSTTEYVPAGRYTGVVDTDPPVTVEEVIVEPATTTEVVVGAGS